MKRFLILLLLSLCWTSIAEATIRYADNATQGGCSNGSATYNPATRRCDDGGSDLVYTGIQAVQNAANVANRGGDTIYIRGWNGVYLGTASNGLGGVTVRQGSSDSNRNIYEGYQNEFPSVRGFGCDFGACDTDYASQLLECRDYSTGQPAPCNQPVYATIRNLKVDGEHIVNGAIGNMGHVILENLEVTNSHEHGIVGIDYAQLINLYVHHNGDLPEGPPGVHCNGLQCHNLYGGPNLLIDGGRYSFARMGIGIQCYPHCGDTIIRNVRLDYNASYGLIVCADCQLGAQGSLVQVYNVVSDHNVNGPGFNLDTGIPIVAYNLLSYSNGGGGICTNANGIVVRNSISNQGIGFCSGVSGSFIGSNNITTGVTALLVDPDNANPDLQDFHLRPSAVAAINLGTTQIRGTITGACQSSPVASGASIVIPPSAFSGPCPDIGAFELAAAGNSPPTITLTSPSNPFSTGAATQTISGTASDSDGSVASVTYTCNRCGTASGPGSGTAGGTPTNWTIPNAPLHAGIQTFTMTATDNLGAPSSPITLTITYTPTHPGNALVGAWAFNDPPGTTADDSSGLGNTGLLINGATFSASGHSQGALSLNGSNHYVSVASANSLNFTQGFTFSAWVMPTGVHTDFRALFAKEGVNDSVQFLFASSNSYCTSGGVLFGAQTNGVSGSQIWNCYSSAIPVNIWTHVAGTYDGTTLTIYINGAVAGTPTPATGLMEPYDTPLRIGDTQAAGGNFQGLIDEARVYNWGIPRTAASNTVPGAACVFGNPLDTAQQSIVRDMNCPVIAAVPPLPIKFPAAPSGLKLGAAAAGAKFGH